MTLKRTPTSTGNRLKGTWSFWVKRNILNGTSNSRYLFYADNGGSQADAVRFNDDDGGDSLRALFWNGTDNNARILFDKLRDPSSWQHYLIVYDSTLNTKDNMSNNDQTLERIKIFVNGRKMIETGGNSTQNKGIVNPNQLMTNWGNIGSINALFATDDGNNKSAITTFDAFFVDGQALTPDVFGFYKEGKGYVSAGSTTATDFRPGQWVPKAPRTIKSEINRKGGFGVNGFYLPMNDSSNFGADFHTTPNSIITLKGEDLPQPRNGAPETTDAYVSQLRTDAYAANLVLAVPGISTATGANLVTNGNFDSDVSNWTAVDATITWSNGRAQTNRTGGSGYTGYQAITVESGKRYTLSGVIDSTGTGLRQDLRILDNLATSGGSLVLNVVGTSGQVVQNSGSFTASQTTYYVYFVSDNSGTGFFDNVVVKQEDAPRDYSAVIKGSGTNKTLTANGNAGVGYEIPSYYGSAMSFDGTGDYFDLGTNADFNFGSGDFTIEFWRNKSRSATESYVARLDAAGGSATSDFWFGNVSGVDGFYWYEGGTGRNVSSLSLSTGQWDHLAAERYGNTITLYVNGVAVGINTAVTYSFNNGTADFRVGGDNANSGNINYPYQGSIQDLRVYKGVAKYKGGFDVPKPFEPVGIESWRAVPDCTANNFATWNPLLGPRVCALGDGNLTASSPDAVDRGTRSTIGVTSGKWYWEYRVGSVVVNSYVGVSNKMTANGLGGSDYLLHGTSSNNYADPSGSFSVTNAAFTTGMIIGCAFDYDAGTLDIYKDGTLAVEITGGSFGGLSYHAHNSFNTTVSDGWEGNFGQNPTFSGNTTAGTYTDGNGKGLFKYQPPSGFLALCEDNLPTPAIADPGEHFKTVLWTGVDGTNKIKCGFQPDFVWIKNRDYVNWHSLYDSIRGPYLELNSNETSADRDRSSNDGLRSFDSDGFTSGLDDNTGGRPGDSYVAWCWKAGGNSNTFNVDGTGYATASAAGITDGSIALTGASVNTTAGFSIVSYTGTATAGTVGHGLGKTPKMVIVKGRSNTDHWFVYNANLSSPTTEYLYLNNTSAVSSGANPWNSTNSTSNVFSLGTDGGVNGNGNPYIAYCWAEIEGFSKFGSYEGSLNADGPFVYCGFKPAVVIIKWADGSASWVIHDSSRTSTNPSTLALLPDSSGVELDASTLSVDFLSNGFKIRNTNGSYNNTSTYIFAAWAESPFQTANAK